MMRAFVLLSGGIDSATCLGLAVRDWGANNVHTYSFDYGQRHFKELLCAAKLAEHYNVGHEIIKLGPQPQSNLTNKDAEIPRVDYADIQGMSPSYHHFRNGQFLAAAATYAVAAVSALDDKEEGTLYIGVHSEDAANWAYADCTPEFIGPMAAAIFIGTYQRIRVKAPLLEMSKDDVICKGHYVLDVPYGLTWSCYLGGDKHCGTCPTCRARRSAFSKAGIVDPTEYEAQT
jgi:7-cyano-7-deazaguanine synthase